LDVPAVAVTLNTNDFGDVKTMAVLAQVAPGKISMNANTTSSNANLAVVSGTQLVETGTYLHGACLADFAIVCGNLPGISIWSPIQSECYLNTLANNIDQTLYMDELFINSLEFGYTTGANATENYGAETDQKMWLLNDGRFVNWEEFVGSTDFGSGYVTLGATATTLSDGNPGFLRTDLGGNRAVTFYNSSENEMTNYEVEAGVSAVAGKFRFNSANDRLYKPTDLTVSGTGDKVFALYAADEYASGTENKYFEALSDASRPEGIGAIRQGQVEVYIVSDTDASYSNAWRLTGCTFTSDLTREPLAELGHLGPYDRPLTLPIPITVTIDTTAGDLEHWTRFANQYTGYAAGDLDDIDLADLMSEESLKLIVKVFGQTDEEAGGSADSRKVMTGSAFIDREYFDDGVKGTYSNGNKERALKTIVVEHLKITDEAYTLDMGTNATQTFGFRSTNDLYVVKGDLSIGSVTDGKKVRRNSS
jgi:hypothetical protein